MADDVEASQVHFLDTDLAGCKLVSSKQFGIYGPSFKIEDSHRQSGIKWLPLKMHGNLRAAST